MGEVAGSAVWAADAVANARVVVLRPTPLTAHLNCRMRDKNATTGQFVTASNRLTRLIVEEAVACLPSTPCTVETPCGTYAGTQLPDESSIVVISILRAADCMVGEVRAMMPSVAVGKILIQRDEETKQPKMMYSKLPSDVAGRPVLLLDPMLATGGSAIMAIRVLVERGCKPESIIFVNVVCCQEGLDAVAKAFPAVRVVTGAIDPVLNEHKYIVPGLGDFGDRYFGTN